MKEINVDVLHEQLFLNKPLLAFDENYDYESWKMTVKDKYREILGLDVIEENSCPIEVDIEEQVEFDDYTRIRYTFESEPGCVVPCYLLIPKNDEREKIPVCICMQGHTTGFHHSIGVAKYEGDQEMIDNKNTTVGLTAVKHGYIALCIEQRGMGERTTPSEKRGRQLRCGCYHTAMTALLLGRTLIGERVWDISKAIDSLSFFERADLDKIVLTGNSGGGTATYYAGCYDKRIKLVVPSCAVAAYRDSIGAMWHCSCNYLPGAARYFDMGELACLIEPRKLFVFNGIYDAIFPEGAGDEVYGVIERIYKKAGVADNCKLVKCETDHFYSADKVFAEIDKAVAEMK